MSNQNKTTPVNSENTEKKMTKYDRKVQARKEAAEREKRRRTISRITAAVVLVLVVLIAVALPIGRRISAKAEYIRLGDHSLNKIEYNFLYNYYTSYTRSMYAYFGMIDTSTPLSEQNQSDGVTWQQYFDGIAVDSIKECLAVYDDAQQKGLTYDVTEDFDAFFKSCEESAKNSSISLSKYLENNFGAYASKSTLKNVLTTYLTATAHYEYLLEQNKPEESEIAREYVENRTDYDTVTYNMFEVQTNLLSDVSDEDIKLSMEEAKKTAEEFQSKYEAGTSFEDLVTEYTVVGEASETEETEFAFENQSAGSISSLYKDWLFDTERAEKDITIIEDETNHSYFVVAFVSRTKPEDTDKNISDALAQEKVEEYVEPLLEKYPLTDSKNHLNLK